MICQKCKKEFEEKDIAYHHLHPKYMDNPKGNGLKITLCKRHHDILHKHLLLIVKKYSNCLNPSNKSESWIWKYVPYENKEICIKEVMEFTKNWVNEYGI